MELRLHLLGPVELRADGRRHPVGPPGLRGILACLALSVGHPVPTDVLIERLWTRNQPTRATIHSYLTRLRAALRAVADQIRIDQRDHGYVLQADPDLIDYHRFHHLHEQATDLADGGRPDQAVALMREAAALWTGSPLENLRGDWAERTRRQLEDEHRAASITRLKLELRLGHAARLVTELTELVDADLLHEEPAELLMRALHESGQSARALEVYQRVQRHIVTELNAQPGRGLRELQRRIRTGDLDAPSEKSEVVPPPHRTNNLHRPLPDFVGRRAEIEELTASLQSPAGDTQGAVVAIDGMPGVGKTALAVHLAHLLAPAYPGARLQLDLGAYGPHDAVDPSAALARLLHQVGVPEKEIPEERDDRAALWRSHLADRRHLVLLDDATGFGQVRHLLPGSSASLVIITSRRRLTGLDGAWPIRLAPMPAEDGAALIRNIVAPDQDDDAAAVSRVVRLCAGLPLAIRVAASGLRDRPARTMRDLAVHLDRTDDVLGALQDEARSVRVAFDLSYRGLRPALSRAFRLLSLHPGDGFTAHAAAAILGRPIEEAARVADLLVDDRLIEEYARGRYRYHDLLRGYARRRAEIEDDDAGRTASRQRLGEYFLATAEKADALLRPQHRRKRIGMRPVVEYLPPMLDADDARRRMEMEISGIIAYAQHEYLRLPELAHAVAAYLETTARWNEAIDIHWRAIKGWQSAADEIGEAAAMVDLAFVDIRCGRREEAEDLARVALDTYRAIGDPCGEADALDRLGLANWHKADYRQAMEHFTASARLRREADDEKGEADALAHSGLVLFPLGRYDTSIVVFERALATYRRIGDIRGQIETLNNLGEVQLRLGRPEDAFRNYTRSKNLSGDVESPQDEAIHLGNIGTCRLELGDAARALDCFTEALRIYREIGDRVGIADALDGVGSSYTNLDRDNDAFTYFQNAIRVSREASEPIQECRSLRHIGTLLTKSGEYRPALSSLEDALAIARRIEDPYETGLTLAELGECLITADRAAEARAHLLEAGRHLRPLGIKELGRVEDRLLGL